VTAAAAAAPAAPTAALRSGRPAPAHPAPDPRPRAAAAPQEPSVDLLLVYTPTARPLEPAHVCAHCNAVTASAKAPERCRGCGRAGTLRRSARWKYEGRTYHEVPLELLYAAEERYLSRPGFEQFNSIMRAKPHRGKFM
jgi:hypothetical protein